MARTRSISRRSEGPIVSCTSCGSTRSRCPQYRDRTTLLVVPELGRDSDVAGNGFANHRSGDESCRRVWLVAIGAGVPKGAGTERPIRTTDVAPTVARILGFKMPECEGRPLAELAF